MNQNIFLLLGSNEGNRRDNLAAARENIQERAGRIVRQSFLYRSAAWGMEEQPDFYNQVLQISSSLSPQRLLEVILEIEQQIGRVRKERWGPRLIDIDLLLYGNQIIDTPSLKVPHPGISQRRFTLMPLAEISPELLHPSLKKTIATLLEECPDTLAVDRINDTHPSFE